MSKVEVLFQCAWWLKSLTVKYCSVEPKSVMRSFVAIGNTLGSAHEFNLHATSSLQFDEVAAKNRSVSKVITLLKDMLKLLGQEHLCSF